MSIRIEVEAWLRDQWDPEITVREWWSRLADSGWGAPMWPVEWGGRGLGRAEATEVGRAFKAAGAIGGPAGLGTLLAAPTILTHGTDEQKRRYLRPIQDGTEAWCQLFSEPGAGSDLASLSCRAERDGDEWVITGQKVWTSHGHLADLGMLIVRTDVDAPKHRGISYFAIDMHQPGIEVRPLKEMTGRSLFNEVFLDGARVRNDALIGDFNAGWAVTNTTLMAERTGLGAGAAGAEGGAFPGAIAGISTSPQEVLRRHDGSAKAMGTLASGSFNYLSNLAAEHGCTTDDAIRQDLIGCGPFPNLVVCPHFVPVRMRVEGPAVPTVPRTSRSWDSRRSPDSLAIWTENSGAGGMLFGSDAPDKGVVAEMSLLRPPPPSMEEVIKCNAT
jgi:hypothetical protein